MNKYTKIKDFHGERAKGVGSSDIPILAGMSRRYGSTTLSLWEQKTGRAEPWAGNNRTEWGHKLEGMVLREFLAKRYGEDAADEFLSAKRRGRSIGAFKTDTECRHPERTYCLAHADLLVDGIEEPNEATPEQIEQAKAEGKIGIFTGSHKADAYIVEAKTTGMMGGKRREGQIFTGYDPDDLTAQGIPDSVFLQIQWQLFCYGLKTAWVAVLIDTADYREYGPIIADARVQEKCLALAERFWRLVESDTPPAPETWDDVARLFPNQTDTTAMVSGEIEQQVREMIAEDKALAGRIKSLEERREDIKNAVGVLIGGNSVLASGEGDVLAKTSETTRESVSLSDLKKKAPDIERQIREAGLVKASTFRTVRF